MTMGMPRPRGPTLPAPTHGNGRDEPGHDHWCGLLLNNRAAHVPRPARPGQLTFLTALVMPSLIGSAASVATFWASAASSLVCAASGLELLARMRGRELDDLRERLGAEQLGGEIERRVGVGARELEHLEAVVRRALAGGRVGAPRARRSLPRRPISSSRSGPSRCDRLFSAMSRKAAGVSMPGNTDPGKGGVCGLSFGLRVGMGFCHWESSSGAELSTLVPVRRRFAVVKFYRHGRLECSCRHPRHSTRSLYNDYLVQCNRKFCIAQKGIASSRAADASHVVARPLGHRCGSPRPTGFACLAIVPFRVTPTTADLFRRSARAGAARAQLAAPRGRAD